MVFPSSLQSVNVDSLSTEKAEIMTENMTENLLFESHKLSDVDADPHDKVFEDGQLLRKILDVTLDEQLMKRIDEHKPVVNFVHPEEMKERIPLLVSKEGCVSFEEIEEMIDLVVKYSTKTSHPHFYNQLYGGVDEVALMSSWLLESLNTNQYTFEVAPVFVVLEHYMINLICKMFDWTDGDGIFAPGGSSSNMYGIVLARHKKYPKLKETGLFGKKELVIFTSDMSHYSILKAASWMGFGTNQVVKVPTSKNGKMLVNELRKAIEKVKNDGKEPFFVNATCGTTVFGAFDPLEEIADVCKEESIWMHVDACWGGGVVLSKKYKHMIKGIGRADSIAWNPHKMLCAPLQCSVFIVKHKGLLADCNRAGASYLFQKDKFYDTNYDLGDKSVQCGRKADVLKLWVMFKVHGLTTLELRIDNAFYAASYLNEQIRVREGFYPVLEEFECTNICFWYVPKSMRNLPENEEWWTRLHKVAPLIKAKMVKKGTLLIGYQPLEGKNLVNFFRMVTTAFPLSTKDDMDFVLDEIDALGKNIEF